MLSFDDYVATDALGLADRIRKKELASLEVVDAAIARAEAVNPKVNAIATPIFDRARAVAKTNPQGPFGGVPWAVKDLSQTIEGVRLTNGSRAFADYVGTTDSEVVKRFARAGLVTIATSTSPEYALSATTESTLHGATRNPWDLSRTSGGSSGGASALVSSGVLPAAHATDGGGSIRGPASCCGLFGLKPSRGRVPIAPGKTEGWGGCSTSHAVTRSVRDSAALLDATHGPELGSRYVAPPPKYGTFSDAVKRDPGKLRIAFHWQTTPGIVPDPDCVAAVEHAAKLCESLGHHVEQAAPKLDYAAVSQAFGRFVVASIGASVRARQAQLGTDSLDLFEQTTREYALLADHFTALHLIQANDTFMTAALQVAEFMQNYDVILSPTMGRPPVPLGVASLMQSSADYGAGTMPFSCFTALQNQTGQPAATVPLYWSKAGLPIGTQFAARVGDEETLFSLAAQLEKAQPWFNKRAPLN
jgi:Asp-tRNA(Asn)/Glu-tRNA(Gln) amidotransferase A subunit family amidase